MLLRMIHEACTDKFEGIPCDYPKCSCTYENKIDVTASVYVNTGRRFVSASHWGMFDVTDYPWCVPLNRTCVVDMFVPRPEYDGTQ